MSAPYVIKKGAAIWWPVKWLEPADGGLVVEQQIEVKFRRVTREGFADLKATADAEDDAAFVQRIALDWRGVADEEGPLAFTETNIRRMLEIEGWATAVGAAFAKCHFAQGETRLGNSAGSPAGGPAAAAPVSTATAAEPS
jgi:hypothetical protein